MHLTPSTPTFQEKPDALLPTMGGQTALNLAVALAEVRVWGVDACYCESTVLLTMTATRPLQTGVLERHGVELIGAKLKAIQMAEDRQLFKEAMARLGLKTPQSGTACTLEQGIAIAETIGSYPLIIRPAFTLGGSGGGIAYNREEF